MQLEEDIEIGSMSRKGIEGRFGYGMSPRSGSHDEVEVEVEVEDFPATVVDPLRQSYWANMPPELLRDVLLRIEESESTWHRRKSVVACAGVCRSWRQVMKEIVGTLQVSGKVTFPISLKQPGPRSSLIQCFIKRNYGMQTYHLYLNVSQASNDEGKFLLAARRCRRSTYTDYIISLNSDVSKGSSNFVGKLRSNFLGTKFTIYDAQPPTGAYEVTNSSSTRLVGRSQVSPRVPVGNYPVARISYELNVLGSRCPRRMHCIMDPIPASAVEPQGAAPTQTELLPAFFRSQSTVTDSVHSVTWPTDTDEALVLKNKSPRWHEQLQCWCLNFNGRVSVASVKNFQLVAAAGGQEQENVILQFGKVGKDTFTMDYQYPLSAFQAFALCLSSFDTKIACE